jgi:hypothetical protein
MDTALVPLYVYIVLLIKSNATLPTPQYQASGDMVPGSWQFTSVFSVKVSMDLILEIIWIAAIAIAGLHLACCGMDLYLIIIFRKIAKLPPDMNPLEDNLTARKRSGHKHKNSEMTINTNLSGDDMTLAERKKLAHMSGSTLSVDNKSFDDNRSVPFGHSRNGSKASLAFSPHNPESARWSRHQFDGQQDLYREAVSPARRSRYEIRPDGKLEVRSRRGSQSPSKSNRSSRIEIQELDISHANLSSSDLPASEYGRAISPPLPVRSPAVPNPAGDKNDSGNGEKKGLLNDNWYVLDAEDDEDPVPAPTSKISLSRSNGYAPVRDRHDSFEPATLVPKPLGMHPPTPPNDNEFPDPDHTGDGGIERNLTNKTNASSVYSESAPSLKSSKGPNGTPKGKYYGDLAAATRGIRSGSPTHSNSPLPPLPGANAVAGLNTLYGNSNGYGNNLYGLPPSPRQSRTPSPEKQSRVISRSGADIADESVLYLHPEENRSAFSMRSRRDVSGKVAEEGRGGGIWNRRD